jgi:hypothetical protein
MPNNSEHHDNGNGSTGNDPEQEGSDPTVDNAGNADSVGNLIPFPRISSETRRSPITGSDWRVERIDTEPMTDEHYRAAVAALAALIVEWEQQQENTDHLDNNTDDAA